MDRLSLDYGGTALLHFCTYFDQVYLTRGLALYRSLRRHCGSFRLWILCMDGATEEALAAIAPPEVRTISLEELEGADDELARAKQDRSRVEYYFTCTPFLPAYLLGRHPEVDTVTYLDADLFFYSSPAPIFDELGGRSVLIIGHRFPKRLRHLESYGIYNVGLLSFRNDRIGRLCLDRWRQQCLDWCYNRLEAGRYADQKYLDDWPTRFPGVTVLQHKGAGLAPWNWMNYAIKPAGDSLLVDGYPLIFYHFQGLRQLSRWVYATGAWEFGRMPWQLQRWLYGNYVKELAQSSQQLRAIAPHLEAKRYNVREADVSLGSLARRMLRRQLVFSVGPMVIC